MSKFFGLKLFLFKRTLSSNGAGKFCAIVGSGPAGFFTANGLLNADNTNTHVHIFDKQPVPGGLVKYGVAPDHPHVKNVFREFSKTASHKNFRFFGNVEMGHDFTMATLRQAYDAIVLCYGAGADRKLNVPGEDANGVHASGSFVGWCNGGPTQVKPEFSSSTAVVIGHGNVAADIARILLYSPNELSNQTTIPSEVVAVLRQSRIKKVYLVGKFGPAQAGFKVDAFQELLNMQNVSVQFNPVHFDGIKERLNKVPPAKRQLIEIMLKHLESSKTISNQSHDSKKILKIEFFKTAREIICPAKTVSAICFDETVLVDPSDLSAGIKVKILSGEGVKISTGLVIKSIGYQGVCVDPLLPFDDTIGKILNKDGRVRDLPGVYCAGWIASGGVGLISDMEANAKRVANNISQDFPNIASKTKDQATQKAFTRTDLLHKLEIKHLAGLMHVAPSERKFAEKLLGMSSSQ